MKNIQIYKNELANSREKNSQSFKVGIYIYIYAAVLIHRLTFYDKRIHFVCVCVLPTGVLVVTSTLRSPDVADPRKSQRKLCAFCSTVTTNNKSGLDQACVLFLVHCCCQPQGWRWFFSFLKYKRVARQCLVFVLLALLRNPSPDINYGNLMGQKGCQWPEWMKASIHPSMFTTYPALSHLRAKAGPTQADTQTHTQIHTLELPNC